MVNVDGDQYDRKAEPRERIGLLKSKKLWLYFLALVGVYIIASYAQLQSRYSEVHDMAPPHITVVTLGKSSLY